MKIFKLLKIKIKKLFKKNKRNFKLKYYFNLSN